MSQTPPTTHEYRIVVRHNHYDQFPQYTDYTYSEVAYTATDALIQLGMRTIGKPYPINHSATNSINVVSISPAIEMDEKCEKDHDGQHKDDRIKVRINVRIENLTINNENDANHDSNFCPYPIPADLIQYLEILTDVVASFDRRISDLESATSTLTQEESMTNQELQDLTDAVTAQTTIQAGVETAITTLSSNVTVAIQKIADLAAQIAANTTDPAAVAVLVARLRENNDGLKADMAKLSDAASSLGAAVVENVPSTVVPTPIDPHPVTPSDQAPTADATVPPDSTPIPDSSIPSPREPFSRKNNK